MKKMIYCFTVAKDVQRFVLRANGREYFLFDQKYRKSNKEKFANGLAYEELFDNKGNVSTAVRNIVSKIFKYIKYIEDEYGVILTKETELKSKCQRNKNIYKRVQYDWKKEYYLYG